MLRSEVGKSRAPLAFGLVASFAACAAWLATSGNPGNMGLCGACFLRDIAGSMQFFAAGPRIFRPEIVGLLFGALAFRLAGRRFQARSGSHAATRFFFGVFMAIGALVFLGCPFRLFQRLGGGDLNAAVGFAGLVSGVGAGLWFERARGYRVGRTEVVPAAVGLLGPIAFLILTALYLKGGFLVGPGPGDAGAPAHATWTLSLGLALVAGAALSATGFCGIAAARQVFVGDRRMLLAALILVATYAVVVAARGRFSLGFANQPIAHGDHLWNALACALVGLCGVLAGGCPVRQVVMAGEGNGDAFVTVAGLLVGGAAAHTLGLVSSATGPSDAGRGAVILGLVLSLAYAFAASRRSPDQ